MIFFESNIGFPCGTCDSGHVKNWQEDGSRPMNQIAQAPCLLSPSQRLWSYGKKFTEDEMKKEWNYCSIATDYEWQKMNVLASIVEYTLICKAGNQLERASFMTPDPMTFNFLKVPENRNKILYPFINMSCCYDLKRQPTGEEFKSKIYSLADKLNINPEKVMTHAIQPALGQQSYWAKSLLDNRPCENILGIVKVKGEHCEDLENWFSFFRGEEMPLVYLPFSSINDVWGNSVSLFLPFQKYHLLRYFLPKEGQKYVLTPSVHEFFLNCNKDFGGVVTTWLGGIDTVEKVDWSPLENHSVVYVVNPDSFEGDKKACLRCMEKVCKILTDKGCRVTLALVEKETIEEKNSLTQWMPRGL